MLSVAPHVGAWIEMIVMCSWPLLRLVAPHVGAWIEISLGISVTLSIM